MNPIRTVDWSVTPGTAGPADYTVVASGTLTFQPGETVKTLSVSLVDDTTDESDESFNITFSNASGALLPADPTVTVKIFDEDAGPVDAIWGIGSLKRDNSQSVKVYFLENGDEFEGNTVSGMTEYVKAQYRSMLDHLETLIDIDIDFEETSDASQAGLKLGAAPLSPGVAGVYSMATEAGHAWVFSGGWDHVLVGGGTMAGFC